jgi:hypothetical protein
VGMWVRRFVRMCVRMYVRMYVRMCVFEVAHEARIILALGSSSGGGLAHAPRRCSRGAPAL